MDKPYKDKNRNIEDKEEIMLWKRFGDERFKLLLFCCIVFIVSLYGSLFLSLMCIFYVVKVVGL